MNHSIESDALNTETLIKEEAIFKIIEGIEKKGYNIDTMDAIEFLEKFLIKYYRYPLYNEIDNIIKSYILSQSQQIVEIETTNQNNEILKEDQSNRVSELKSHHALKNIEKINKVLQSNHIERIVVDNANKNKELKYSALNKDLELYNLNHNELERITKESLHSEKKKNETYEIIKNEKYQTDKNRNHKLNRKFSVKDIRTRKKRNHNKTEEIDREREIIKRKVSEIEKLEKIDLTCPTCKMNRIIEIPEIVVKDSKKLFTINIQKDTVCEHTFQVFLDKNFSIRGYQKVDFEYESREKLKKKIQNSIKRIKNSEKWIQNYEKWIKNSKEKIQNSKKKIQNSIKRR